MATLDELGEALKRAGAAGNVDDARALAQAIRAQQQGNDSDIARLIRGEPPKKQTTTATDIGRSIPGGLAKGAAAIAGLPGDIGDLMSAGVDAGRYQLGKAIYGDKYQFHPSPSNTFNSAGFARALSYPFGGFYQPQTTAGKYAETIASFAPAAVAPGGIPTRIARVVIPGVGSEAGGEIGQAVGGDTGEAVGRVVGAVGSAGVIPAARVASRAIGGLANRASEATLGVPLRNPTTQAQNAIRASIAQEGGTAPITQRLNDWAASGASNPALIDVSGNATRRLVRGAAGSPEGEAQNLAQSYADQIAGNLQERAVGHARGLTPGNTQTVEQYSEALKNQRRAVSKPIYEEAFANNENIGSQGINDILATPAGKSALGQARIKMRNDRAPMGEAETERLGLPAPSGGSVGRQAKAKDETLFEAIRRLGGIRTHDKNGYVTREGGEVREALKDQRTSGIISPSKGMYPDYMREALQQEGWFGRTGTSGQDLDELYAALKTGRDFRHPESAAVEDAYIGAQNASNLDEARTLADELGISYGQNWSADDIYRAADAAENAAVRTGGAAPGHNLRTLDYVKRALDDKIEAAQRAGANDDARILTGLKNDLVSELESADQTGAYSRARATFAERSKPIEAVDVGSKALNTPADEYAAQIADLATRSPQARQAAGVGYARTIQNAFERSPEGALGPMNRVATSTQQSRNLAETYGQPTAGRFQSAVGNEAQRLRNARFISPNTGSQTEPRLAENAMVNLASGRVRMWVHVVDGLRSGRILTAREKAEVVRLGTSEADLRRIITALPNRSSTQIAQQIAVTGALGASNPGRNP